MGSMLKSKREDSSIGRCKHPSAFGRDYDEWNSPPIAALRFAMGYLSMTLRVIRLMEN